MLGHTFVDIGKHYGLSRQTIRRRYNDALQVAIDAAYDAHNAGRKAQMIRGVVE